MNMIYEGHVVFRISVLLLRKMHKQYRVCSTNVFRPFRSFLFRLRFRKARKIRPFTSVWIVMSLVIPSLTLAQQSEKKLEFSPGVHLRMFWMSTNYSSDFKYDYALGTSLNLGTKLTYAKKLQLMVGYRFFGNLWSSDLSALDPLSQNGNRYEVGLFDLLNKEDRFFGKLENLSLSPLRKVFSRNYEPKLVKISIKLSFFFDHRLNINIYITDS